MVKSEMTSREFSERSTLIEKDLELSVQKHAMKMKEFAYLRESERLKHEWELERNRIKSAEIRKTQMRRDAFKQ